ncbi:MAG: ABC transporter permease [Acidobacteriota bacterium]
MADSTHTMRFRFWLWLIRAIGVIVPRRLRADWRQEWEAELQYRELLLADWDKLNWKTKLDLLRRSLGAFRDAMLLQPQRLEDDMFQDVRFGLRMLLKKPGFTLIAVLTMALGIGANTAMFSVVNAVLLNPLPFPEPERLIRIYGHFFATSQDNMSASVPEFTDYREQTSSFEQIAGYDDFSANLTPKDGEPERVEALLVTPELFSVLKVTPQAGRVFMPEEAQDGHDDVVLISDELWRRRFGTSPNLVGEKVIVNGRNNTVIGIMPPGFAFPQRTELWKPLWFPADQLTGQSRGNRGLDVIGRLKQSVTASEAQAEMDHLAARLTEQYPRNYESRGWSIGVVPLLDDYVGEARKGLLVLLGAVAFVMLIACANVANLSLTRATARRQEIALRLALGATRLRVTRQLLTESVLLALAGGAAGLLIAAWGTGLLLRFAPDDLPRIHEVRMDGRVLAFTFAVSLVTGVLFGLVPALAASNPDLNETLKEGGRGGTGSAKRQRMRSAFVIAEITLALVLLVGAGLMLKSFWRLQRVDPGFNPDGVLTMRMMLPFEIYEKPSQRGAFYKQALERIGSAPGVEAVSATSQVPLTEGGSSGTISGENSAVGPTDLPVEAEWRWVTPDYFKAIGTMLMAGRDFTDADAEGAPPVAVVDESFAERYYPNEDPVGKRIKRGKLDSTRPWMTIVGVVRHVQSRRLDATSGVQVYFPFYRDPTAYNMSLVVRTSAADPLSLSETVRAAIQSLDNNQPVYDVFTLRQIVGDSMSQRRFAMLLMGMFAAVALALAAVGIYGVMSYSVAQRTHEIGIRVALGATTGEVLKMVIAQGMTLTSIGVTIGLAAAFALTRLLETLLFGISATDWVTYAEISALLTGVALLACYLPARRATQVDPMIALRQE